MTVEYVKSIVMITYKINAKKKKNYNNIKSQMIIMHDTY